VLSRAQRPLNVLLVEDSEADAELVREAFDDAGSRVELHTVPDANQALERLDDPESRPDVILLDLRLPGRSGFHVLDRVKGDEALCHIPVVVLSSSVAPPDVTRAYRGHANTYMRKPGDFAQLVEMMACVDEYWRERAELAFSD